MKELTRPKTMLIIVLAIIMAMIVPLKAAAAPKNQFLGDLYLAYGKDAESAKQVLIDKGFTPIEGNLNDGGDTYSMLGYKTTDDIRYAITDVAVMSMRGGYSVEDYYNALREKKSEIAGFLEEFMVVVKEYRANYDAGRTRAVYVHDLLNKYTDDDTGMKLGDLFLADTLQDKVGIQKSVTDKNKDKLPDLITILLQGNSEVVKSVELLLSMATDTSDDTWLDRFSKLTYDDLLDQVAEKQPGLNTEAKQLQYLDNIYGSIAGIIAEDMANIRDKLTAYEKTGLDITIATEDDIKKTFGDPEALEGEEAVKSALAAQDWMETGALYENLKAYEGGRFKKGELLEFFMEETDPDDVERLYPIVASLSEGQWYGLPFVSFEMHLGNAFADEKTWKSQAESAKAIINGLDELSVYANIDRDIYRVDGTVAITDKAMRENNTVNGIKGTEKEQWDAWSITTAVSWAVTGLSLGVTLGAAAKTGIDKLREIHYSNLEDALQIRDLADTASDWSPEYYAARNNRNALYAKGSADLKSGVFLKYAAYATIAIGIISALITGIDLLRDTRVDQLPIPRYLVDSRTDAEGNGFSVNYKVVECNREEHFGKQYFRQVGNCADLLADEGKQWLALYVSRNSLAGNPVLADFAVQKESQAPSGLTGNIHIVGEQGAVNIASGSFRNYNTFTKTINLIKDKTQYMFYGVSDTPKTYDESAGNMTATYLSSGTAAIFGFGGMTLGVVLGALLAVMLRKKKETETA